MDAFKFSVDDMFIPLPFLNINGFVCRRYARFLVLVGPFILVLAFPQSIRAQIRIITIVENNQPASSAPDITCSRRGSRPPVISPMDLQDGDKLSSKSTTKIVKVTCSGAIYTLTAPFQVTFTTKNTSAGSVCYAGFGGSAGQVSVRSNNTPTITKSGRGRILTKRTQYAIKISPGKRRLGFCPFLICLFSKPITREWIVFEDEAELKRAGTSRTIKQGEKVVTGEGSPEISRVTQEDIQRTAEFYARVDVSQARFLPDDQRSAEVPKLLTLHAAVLADPKNVQKQDDLKAEQNRIGVQETVPVPSQTPGPTLGPTAEPTPTPTLVPTPSPVAVQQPTARPTPTPTAVPTIEPTAPIPIESPMERNSPLDAEQTRLIDLITQGKYREAIAGFERRVHGPHATSLDAYELAVAYEHLLKQLVTQKSKSPAGHRLQARNPSKLPTKKPIRRNRQRRSRTLVPLRKRPALYAKKALKLNQTDRRLSQKEQDDSRRIARGK